jgi:hypothetical protein
MGQTTVDPGSLESAAALLRGAHGEGVTMLARAIVDDLRIGAGVDESLYTASGLGELLPQVTEFVRERTEAMSAHLDTAAGSYRRTDWLVRVALAAQS